MPKLDGSVGQGAENRRHDVAVVQAALGKARGRDRKPFWPGPIDGDYPRHRRALDQSIAVFQQCHRLRPSGKMNRLGSDVDRLETALPASHRRMSGVPGTVLVRRRNSAAPAPAAEAAARTEATAPLPDVERGALAALQRGLFEAHKLCFTVSGVGVVSGGRFRVSLACPDSEWLDLRRNVFELGGKLPPALRQGLEGTLRGAARAWKPASGDSPCLVLASARAFAALHPGAAPKGEDLDAFAIAQIPGEPTARACLAACLELATSGEAQTPAGRKQFDELAEAVGVMHPQTAKALATGLQTAQAGSGTTPLSQRVWVNPTGRGIRSDLQGGGHFGAPRVRGGKKTIHLGVDYVSTPRQTVVSPTDGTFSRNIRYLAVTSASPQGTSLPGIEIRISATVVVQLIYVNPFGFSPGQPIKVGDPIGTAVSIVPPYAQGTTNHVHLEIEDRGSGSKQFIDAATLIPQPIPPIPRRRP
jgi:hypothetical protein